jgi:hypothetical protein
MQNRLEWMLTHVEDHLETTGNVGNQKERNNMLALFD